MTVFNLPPPKSVSVTYRGTRVTFAFDPATKAWGYKFVHTQDFEFKEDANTLDKIKKLAYHKIDKLKGD